MAAGSIPSSASKYRRVLGGLLAAVVVLSGLVTVERREDAAAAVGAVNLLFTAGGDPARYGANQVVALEAGNINFVADCEHIPGGTATRPTPGIPDQFQPFADLYIVPAGSSFANNAKLVATAGAPNTVHGGLAGSFLYEPLGATKPTGKIGSGTYGVVVDECQNGVFDNLEDTFVDVAFRVDVTQEVPGFGSELAAFQALKERAATGASALQTLDNLLKLYAIIEQAKKMYDAVNAISTQGLAVFVINQAVAGIQDASGYTALQDRAKALARATIAQHRVRLRRLSADPPDPDFARFALPAAAGAHMEESTDELGELWATHTAHLDALSALTGSILDGIERYQGADEAGDAVWALRHARSIIDATTAYELLLADFEDASAQLEAQIDADFGASGYTQFIRLFDNYLDNLPDAGLQTSYQLLNTGQDPALGAFIVRQHENDLLGPVQDSEAEWLAGIGSARQAMVDFGTTLPDIRALVGDREAQLGVILGDDDQDPDLGIDLAGTPSAGSDVTLAVTGLAGDASVAWDLDGDGEADDANGSSVVWTVPGDAIAGVPLIVSVTASGAGFTTSSSRVVTVADGGNQPPAVEPLATQFEEVAPGTDFTYTAAATDPDGDPLTYTWLVDSFEQPGETSATFTLDTDTSDFGGRLVEVLVSDGQALTRQAAFVSLTTEDADNDQYLAAPGPDCTEVDTPQGVLARLINPGRPEILGNGADDDCNPDTPDVGAGGSVLINGTPSTASAGETVTKRIQAWSHPQKFSGDEFELVFDWGDGTDPDVLRRSGTTGAETDFGDLTHQYPQQQLSVEMRACIEHLPTGDTFCHERGISIVNNRPIVNAADFRTFGPNGLGFDRPGRASSGEWVPLDPFGQRMISSGNPSNYVILPSNAPLAEGAGYGRVTYDWQQFATGDDDWMGLVLGYQEGEHDDAAADFVGVWWGDRLGQPAAGTATLCNDAPEGLRPDASSYLQAFRQNGLANAGEIVENTTYAFPYDPTDDAIEEEPAQSSRCDDDMGRELLADAPLGGGLIGSLGWKYRADTQTELEITQYQNDPYLVEIDYQPDSLTVWIDGEEQLVATPSNPDDPFPPGGVGLYSASQNGTQMAVTAPERTFDFTQGKGGEFSDLDPDGISIPMHDSPFDTHTIRVRWGDGSATTEGVRTPNAAKGAGWYDVGGTHVYEEAGTFRGEVCATDQLGLGMCFPFTAVVANAAPIVEAGEDRPVDGDVSLDDMTFQDPGRFDTHTATIDWGDDSGPQPADVDETLGGGTVSGTHTYTDSGDATVEVCVTDQHGAEACDTRTLTVLAENATPQALSTSGLSGPEGTALALPVGFTDGNVDDTHTVTVDWGDLTAPETVDVQDGGDFGSGTPTHVYADNDTYAATIKVCDQQDACGQTVVDVGVDNEAPAVTATVELSGGHASLAGSFGDPGTGDTHTATVNWGDGAGAQPVDVTPTAPGSGTVTDEHDYTSTGTFTVALCVTDDDGDTGCDGAEFEVTEIDGTAPTVTVGDILPGVEGDSVTVDGTFDDPDVGDTHTATVDWGDGSGPEPATVDDGAGTVAATHTYGDDDGGTPFTVSVTVCDSTDRCDTDSADVAIGNADPVVDAGRDRSSNLELVLDDSTFTDPGTDDTHTATVDWGDGAGPEAAPVTGGSGGGNVQASHTYPTTGPRTVTVCVTDDDGGAGCDTFEATIAVPPIEVDATEPAGVDEGDPVTVPFSFSDPSGGAHTVTVRWADGSAPEVVALDTDGTTGGGAATHSFGDDGDFGVTVEVCSAVDCGQAAATVSVANVAPDAQPPTGTVTGSTLDVEAAFTDPGTGDTHSAMIDWGDGTSEAGTVTGGPGAGTVTGSHTYAAGGEYTVEVCVTDDDAGSDCASAPHTVADPNVAPSVTIDDPGDLDEGESFNLTGSLTDPDADTWTLTVDWGDGEPPETIPLATAGPFSIPHTYPDDGTFTIVATASDGADEDVATIFGVDVANVAPGVETAFTIDQLTVDLLVDLNDPGADTLSATVDWGDGTIEDAGPGIETARAGPANLVIAAASDQLFASHTYPGPGTYDTEVCGLDGDGGRTCVQEEISVVSASTSSTSTTTTSSTTSPSSSTTTGDERNASGRAGAGTTRSPVGAPGSSTGLSATGSETSGAVQLALTLLAVGVVLVLANPRRRRASRR